MVRSAKILNFGILRQLLLLYYILTSKIKDFLLSQLLEISCGITYFGYFIKQNKKRKMENNTKIITRTLRL